MADNTTENLSTVAGTLAEGNSSSRPDDSSGDYTHIVIPVVFGCNCLLGIVGNLLVIYVILKNSKMKTVANMYILSLATADLFFMFTMPFVTFQHAEQYWPFGFAWCKLVMAVDGLNQTTGIYCLTAMAVDRYFAIVHPIRSIKIRTKRIAAAVNISCWVLSCVTVMPLWLYTRTIFYPEANTTICTLTWPYKNFQKLFYIYMFIFGLVLPVFIITVCYMLMIKRLYTGVAALGESNTKKPTKKVARMVLTVIFVFVVCWTPFYGVQLYTLTTSEDWMPSQGFLIGYYFTICLSYFNSSINPFIYSFMSDNFRKCFAKVITCKRLADVDVEQETKLNSGGNEPRAKFNANVNTVATTHT